MSSALTAAATARPRPLPRRPRGERSLPWVRVAPGAPYFMTERGDAWTPMGQNDAITWPELDGLFRRRDRATAEAYVALLAESGVSCMRLMLEYAQGNHRYLERPAGSFVPSMVRLWDDLFVLCERHGVRVLLTPYDTFWMWLRWGRHPYNRKQGGPGSTRRRWLLCGRTRAAIKARLAFATERWGGSGALFGWDLWNEIHPAHAEDSADCFGEFIDDVGEYLRRLERTLHGRAHPQTVSVFGPAMELDGRIAEFVFRHPALDVASTHFYEHGTIDDPRDTVAPAVSTGRLVRQALDHTPPERPFFDSEHGPIHTFKDHGRTLPEPFDDEYFRHMQWAHLASGGAGGGMRWPNRHPHSLTAGMRRAQRAMSAFLPLVDWPRFRRRNLGDALRASDASGTAWAAFGCGDERQAVAWLLRTDSIGRDGRLRRDARPAAPRLVVPGLDCGRYVVTTWDTEHGAATSTLDAECRAGVLELSLPPIVTDLAVAVRAA